MTITFVGHGYVGLVTAAVFADLGNIVWVIGHTQEKIDNLNKGIIPIYEPGLSEIVQRNVKAKRLLFTLDYDQAIKSSSVVFIAVGTPSKATGDADLSVVYEVAEKIGKHLDGYTVVVTKSTVPVGTNKKTRELIERVKPEKATFDLASVPEFLREGQAISDTLRPDRIVIGTDSKKAEDVLIELHEPIDGNYVLTNIETAEMIKYAANAFLSVKISFANAIAFLSELAGADGLKVLEGIGYDKRIGNQFLSPGAGYGGSCFPKDVRALIHISKQNGYRFTMLEATEEVNKQAMEAIVTQEITWWENRRSDNWHFGSFI
jgi:UDPglucose 6-dehydrogenase